MLKPQAAPAGNFEAEFRDGWAIRHSKW